MKKTRSIRSVSSPKRSSDHCLACSPARRHSNAAVLQGSKTPGLTERLRQSVLVAKSSLAELYLDQPHPAERSFRLVNTGRSPIRRLAWLARDLATGFRNASSHQRLAPRNHGLAERCLPHSRETPGEPFRHDQAPPSVRDLPQDRRLSGAGLCSSFRIAWTSYLKRARLAQFPTPVHRRGFHAVVSPLPPREPLDRHPRSDLEGRLCYRHLNLIVKKREAS